jgi:hypothetical protein
MASMMKAAVHSRSNMLKNIQYITDSTSKRLAVILPLDDYGELLASMEIIPLEVSTGTVRRPAEIIAELVSTGKIDLLHYGDS